MIINSAIFKCSSERTDQCPELQMPEFAFIGRSNVGKSSLINMITNNKGLAKVSGTPGKTRLINHFVINDNWALVDLPGYGYAKASKSNREIFDRMIRHYILNREPLGCLFVLVDSRHEPQAIDLKFLNFLGENTIPFAIVFTKADKLSSAQLKHSIDNYKRELLNYWEQLPPLIITSAEKGRGKDDLLNFIENCINDLQK